MVLMTSFQDIVVEKFERLRDSLNERTRREFAAAEALALGHGGVSLVSRAIGIARSTIYRGIHELEERERGGASPSMDIVRGPGGGRKPLIEKEPSILDALEALVEPDTRGDPESPLRWTSKSTVKLAAELVREGYEISARTVSKLLRDLGYSLQANRKTTEGANHPDRDAQFQYINRQTTRRIRAHEPVISVDTKKRELVGNFKNNGRELRPKGEPEEVRVHDFVIPELGRATPYGVYDIANDKAWVSVGITADTSTFAVESIRRWWYELGSESFPDASRLLITADCGGSNGYRVRLWKYELQGLADELGLPITVCHFPPGTSKWNKIEHRLFSFITMNWRGKPLASYQTIVNLISATTTNSGLEVVCELDDSVYTKGRKIADEEMATVRLRRHRFHGDWNYTIRPSTSAK